jgi:predicted Zn-dependent peptidase
MSDFDLIKETLPGGLRAVLLPRHERQTVTFLVLIGVGSRYETPPQSGLSHFLEHMFFKGTTTRPSSKQIAEAIDGIGGEFNAFTGEEYTGYYVKVAAEHLERGAEVVADILLRPLFAEPEIERERGVITEEIRMYTSVPMHHVQHLWQEALFGTHPLGRRIDGAETTVATFKRSDFVRYAKKHYHTKNAVVAVAGNFAPDQTKILLQNLFEPLAKGEAASPRSAPKRQPAHRLRQEYRKGLPQTQLMVGVPGLPLRHPQRWAADVMATILGAGMSSRLFLSVRERHGLAYSVRSSSDNYTDAGSFVTQSGVRTDKLALALRLILEEYDRIMTEPVTLPELNKAKQMLTGHLMLELEETNSLASFAAGQELLTGSILIPTDIKERIEAVTPSDVQQVAQKLLNPTQRAVAILGPQRSTAELERLLEQQK